MKTVPSLYTLSMNTIYLSQCQVAEGTAFRKRTVGFITPLFFPSLENNSPASHTSGRVYTNWSADIFVYLSIYLSVFINESSRPAPVAEKHET